MFLKVYNLDKDNNLVGKHINLSNVSLVHNCDMESPYNKAKFASVIYTTNGYAVYSRLTAEQVVSYIQEHGVVTEDDVLAILEGEK